jgi:hypothetical protein
LHLSPSGNGQYSPDTGVWPKNQDQWWSGQILVNIAGFTIFALFCEGIMNICAKISNPLDLSDIAFSEKVYGKTLCVCASGGTFCSVTYSSCRRDV